MTLHRLLGFRVAVPDPAELAGFYGELGLRAEGSGRFVGSDGGASVQITDGPFRRLLSVEVGCADDDDLAAVERRVTDGGASVRRLAGAVAVIDCASRVELVVRVAPPEERGASADPVLPNAPGRTVRRERRAPAVSDGPRSPRRLGHLVIGTPDLEATRALLVDGLGLKVSDSVEGLIHFLRCSVDHHNVALVHAPVPLLQHYSWECDDVDHLGHTASAIVRADPARHTWGLGRHFIGSNYYWYVRDPAGSFVELYSDLDQILDDEEWERAGRTPVGLEHIANAWGPELPPEFVVPADLPELEAGWAAVSA